MHDVVKKAGVIFGYDHGTPSLAHYRNDKEAEN
jgi:hypothetical protein